MTIKPDEAEVIVRSGPGTTYAIVGKLQSGQKTAALGISKGSEWIQIEFPQAPDKKTWLFASLVDRTQGSLPVVDPESGGATSSDSTPAVQGAARPEAIAAIQRYLKKESLSYQYLREDVNLNSPDLQKVDRYSVDGVLYQIDLETNWIAGIDATAAQQDTSQEYPAVQLRAMAVQLIANLAPGIDLTKMAYETGQKGDFTFFRWTEKEPAGFIQVGYTRWGGLSTYTNALSRQRPAAQLTFIPNSAGLTIEEDLFLGDPQQSLDPLALQPAHGSWAEVRDRHAGQKQPVYPIPYTVFDSGSDVLFPMNGGQDFTAVVSYANGNAAQATLQVKQPGKVVFQLDGLIFVSQRIPQTLWLDGSHWVLEVAYLHTLQAAITGRVYQDGQLLNEQYGYQEMFNFRLLDGKPLYFYQKDGKVRLSYNSQDLPMEFDAVPHYGCCGSAEVNPQSGPNWLTFWARRGTQWFYVQIGKY